jgi:hypothetical protein
MIGEQAETQLKVAVPIEEEEEEEEEGDEEEEEVEEIIIFLEGN